MMDKIFKRGLSKSMKKWAFFTLPAKRLEFAYKEIDKATPLYNSVFVSRVGAIDHFSHLIDQIRFRSKAFAFKKLIEHIFNIQIEEEHNANFNDKLELLNRNSTLMA